MSIIGYIPRRIDDTHADCRVADSGAYILKDEMSVIPESSGVLNEAAVYNYVASELVPYEQFTYLTSGEVSQVQNIGEVAISNAQWNYVGTMNQNVASTGIVMFSGVIVSKGISGAIANSSSNIFVVENNGPTGMSFISPNANAGQIYFGCPSDDRYAWIYSNYNTGTPYLQFGTNRSTTHMRLVNNNVLIGTTTDDGINKLQVKGGISCNTLMASGLPTADPGVAGQVWASGQNLVISVG